MASALEARITPARRLAGHVRVPGDKSISHRYALVAALARGPTRLTNYSPGGDCTSTLACLRRLGVQIEIQPGPHDRPGARTILIEGRGLRGLQVPDDVLDAGNSGTTTRLLAGVLAAHPFSTTITGDESLRRRPMKRVIEPLSRMGARFESSGGSLPLTIIGSRLSPIEFVPAVPSAQVKSAILLAGLQTDGRTTVRETVPTRDHTELALGAFGAAVERLDGTVSVTGGRPLSAIDAAVPGDVSSATFWAVAAAALPGSDVEIVDLGLNPSRTALLDVLTRAGALVDRTVDRIEHGEPRGRVRIRHDQLRPLTLGAEEVPGLIDELPALAAMATAGGELTVTGAGELRVKESDRISALAAGFRAMGADVEEFPDGFHIRGARRLTGGSPDAVGDHRLAMAFAIAGLASSGPTTISGAEAVDVSYPGFFETLSALVRED
jgi:3-phosphoshikimate 1-carboxyvinyltransferase